VAYEMIDLCENIDFLPRDFPEPVINTERLKGLEGET
jgi:hypothetical protein|tara:strand:+ start:212 stop:322 length:111 start_codon:yes stop_codon:yes gene_type:complete